MRYYLIIYLIGNYIGYYLIIYLIGNYYGCKEYIILFDWCNDDLTFYVGMFYGWLWFMVVNVYMRKYGLYLHVNAQSEVEVC